MQRAFILVEISGATHKLSESEAQNMPHIVCMLVIDIFYMTSSIECGLSTQSCR